MKRQHQMIGAQHSRRETGARALGRDAFVATSPVGAVAMLATQITAKTNPRWVSGGLPREGER